MIRLFIENYEADIAEGFSHQITYAIDDLNNFDSKATSFSKTIVLPGTSKNNSILGNIFEFTNSNFTIDGPNVFYNFNASKSAKCRLEINGLQIIKGVLRLLEIIRDGDSIEYEVAIFGELGGFVAKLSNKKLEDLDFSAYNHYYTTSNIKDSWDLGTLTFTNYYTAAFYTIGADYYVDILQPNLDNYLDVGSTIHIDNTSFGGTIDSDFQILSIIYTGTATRMKISGTPAIESKAAVVSFQIKKGFGYYYPLIDYGNYSDNKKDYKYKTFRPALFVREYMDKIITGAGYTYESKFFNTDFFSRLIIPHNQQYLQTIKSDLFYGQTIFKFEGRDNPTDNFVNKAVGISKVYGDEFTTTDNETYTYNGTSTTLIIDANVYFRIRIASSLSLGNVYNGTYTTTTAYYVNNVITSLQYTQSGTITIRDTYYDIHLNGNIPISNGDSIQLRVYFQFIPASAAYGKLSAIEIYANKNIKYNSQYPIVTKVDLGDLLEINRAIPKNIFQKDFFSSILKMFYLMVTEDKYKEKHLKIEPWTWFFNLNASSYIDWTMKLDRSQPIHIKPMSEANARYYDIKYKSDTDYYNDNYKKRYSEGYGDVRFDNQLEFAKDAQTTEVIFSATPLVGYLNRDKVVSTILKWNNQFGVSGYPINEETINSNIRILQAKKITDIESWKIYDDDGTTILDTITRYPYAGHLDDPDVPSSDLNFGATKELFFSLSSGALGNNLFNAFYSSYLAEITDKDSRLVTAKLKLNDTDIFNLDFSRFIYLDGVLYRLSKIVDYTPGETCTVELLRVIYTTYDNSVNSADEPEVVINGVTWKSKNHDGEYYRNGDLIPEITDETEWSTTTEGAWCYYENLTSNGIEYGKLYNWYAVNDPRGLAPVGYHVATQSEFDDLFAFVSNDGNKLKESGLDHWDTNAGTNETGFNAFGGGYRRESGVFIDLKHTANFWTADEYNSTQAYYNKLDNAENITNDKKEKGYGYSVRLVKD